MKNTIIRQGAFETNSSSSHSIAIDADTFVLDTSLIPDDTGTITIYGQDFGWEWARYNDARTKMEYAFADQGRDAKKRNMLMEVIKEQTGALNVVFPTSIQTEWGLSHPASVDHQSTGNAAVAFETKEMLRHFIFNTNSVVFTGNDNGSAPRNFYIINTDKATFRVEVVGFEKQPIFSDVVICTDEWTPSEIRLDDNVASAVDHFLEQELKKLGIHEEIYYFQKEISVNEDESQFELHVKFEDSNWASQRGINKKYPHFKGLTLKANIIRQN